MTFIELYKAIKSVFKDEKPLGWEEVVTLVQQKHPTVQSYEIKATIWALISDRVLDLTSNRDLVRK